MCAHPHPTTPFVRTNVRTPGGGGYPIRLHTRVSAALAPSRKIVPYARPPNDAGLIAIVLDDLDRHRPTIRPCVLYAVAPLVLLTVAQPQRRCVRIWRIITPHRGQRYLALVRRDVHVIMLKPHRPLVQAIRHIRVS